MPEGFQRSEYLKEHGMVDMVVPRTEIRATIGDLLTLLMKRPKFVSEIIPPPLEDEVVADEVSESEHVEANSPEAEIIETPKEAAE